MLVCCVSTGTKNYCMSSLEQVVTLPNMRSAGFTVLRKVKGLFWLTSLWPPILVAHPLELRRTTLGLDYISLCQYCLLLRDTVEIPRQVQPDHQHKCLSASALIHRVYISSFGSHFRWIKSKVAWQEQEEAPGRCHVHCIGGVSAGGRRDGGQIAPMIV